MLKNSNDIVGVIQLKNSKRDTSTQPVVYLQRFERGYWKNTIRHSRNIQEATQQHIQRYHNITLMNIQNPIAILNFSKA
jgi:hypothetical protein